VPFKEWCKASCALGLNKTAHIYIQAADLPSSIEQLQERAGVLAARHLRFSARAKVT